MLKQVHRPLKIKVNKIHEIWPVNKYKVNKIQSTCFIDSNFNKLLQEYKCNVPFYLSFIEIGRKLLLFKSSY